MRELINILEKIKHTKHEENRPVTVSIVGGGGKTTLLYVLGKYLCETGNKVLMTTTTMVEYPEDYQKEGLERIVIGKESFIEYASLKKPSIGTTLKSSVKPVLMGDYVASTGENKIKGFEKEAMEALEKEGLFKTFDYILIEADGAKKCPIKAPGENEPVIINSTDLVIGVVGMDSIGLSLEVKNVLRLKELCDLLNKKENDIIEENDIKTLVLSKNGLFKNVPEKALTALVLNKSEGVENIEKAERMIHEIRAAKESQKIDYYFVASLEQELLYKYFPLKIANIVFGAGNAKRMGAQKLLLELHGTPILQKVLQTVEKIDFTESREDIKGVTTKTVLVYNDNRIKELAKNHKIDLLIKNPEPERGLSSSLKLAIEKVDKDFEAYMFFMGDQPFITKESIENIIKLWLKDTSRIVVPYYAGKRGNPVLIPSVLYEKLMKVEGDQGGRELIKSNLDKVVFMEVENSIEGLDIDDPATYESLKDV